MCKNAKMNILRCLILAVAIASVIFGIYSGEAETIFRKAAAICLECCGIG